MADNPPALEQHHCDAGANFVRIDRPNKHATCELLPNAARPQSKGNHQKMAKLKEEFFKILPPTIFFFVALHIVMFIRVLMLEGTGLKPSSSVSIAVAALILGKAVLIADMVPMINRFPNRPLIYNVAWKTLIYWLMATLIHYVERLIDFWRQTGSFVAGNRKLFTEIIWPHFWAIQIVLFVLIAMYCMMHELVRVIGKEKAMRIFFGPMPAPEV
jgi:hypothetical protein